VKVLVVFGQGLFLGCALFSVCAGVPKLGQRGEVQDLMAKAFVGSNPTPCTTSQKCLKMCHHGDGSGKQSVRVKSWEEFKKLTLEKKPRSIVYVISQSIPARNLTSLQLIVHAQDAQYLFTDFAKGDKLRQTGIPIHTDAKGNRFLEDSDGKSFLKTQWKREGLQIFSY
jgi:hypothetical protein